MLQILIYFRITLLEIKQLQNNVYCREILIDNRDSRISGPISSFHFRPRPRPLIPQSYKIVSGGLSPTEFPPENVQLQVGEDRPQLVLGDIHHGEDGAAHGVDLLAQAALDYEHAASALASVC